MSDHALKPIDVVAGMIVREGKALIAQRKAEQHLGGLWEFPGGKIEVGEPAYDAVVRELQEEIGVTVTAATLYDIVEFTYPEKTVRLQFWTVTAFDGEPITDSNASSDDCLQGVGCEGHLLRWVDLKDLDQYQFPEANLSILKRLLA